MYSPEGSATSSSIAAAAAGIGGGGANNRAADQSANVGGTPRPPPGYGDENNGSAESFCGPTAAVGKWPLKPGVLVHSKQQLLKSPATNAALRQPNVGVDHPGPATHDDDEGDDDNGKSKNRAIATERVNLTNETQSARAARIRRMMIGTNNNVVPKKPSPASPPPAPPVRKNPISDDGNRNNRALNVPGEKTPSPAAAPGRR